MAVRYKDAHLSRVRQIGVVLVRHGLGFLIGIVGLERMVPFQGLRAGRAEHASRPVRVRLALEELGATFIKLGQIMSTRVDLLPSAYIVELAKLQDAVSPVPAEVVHETILAEFGRPVEAIFATFDFTPLAAASIGQAHAATLPDGTAVVVKVRRPGVAEQVQEDLEILENLAAVATRRWEPADEYDVVGLAQEFGQTLRAELDYLREARNAERIAANFADDPNIHIPRVFWDTTTSRVLTLERIRGIKITDLPALTAAGIDRSALAERAARLVLKMVFEHRFFHADPHPGNFFIEPDGRIGLIDFGMVGAVDERTQEHLIRVLLAVTGRDADTMVDAFLDLGVTRRRINRDALRLDLEHLISRYYGRALGEIAIAPLLTDALTVARRHHLHVPSNLALLLKTVVMDEALGVQLDPGFNLTAVLVPYAQRLMLRQYSPVLWAQRFSEAGLEAARLGVEAPRHIRRIISALERGDMEVGMRPAGFDPLIRRFERLANRIILGIITAAFINGLAVLLSVYHLPGWERWAGAAFALGFVAASVLGAYLAWTILRSGRG